MINYIYMILSMIIDSIIKNHISYQINNISILSPLFSIVAISVIYKSYGKKTDNYLKDIIIFSLIYSLCYSNNIIINIFSFFLIGLINITIYKYLMNNSVNTVAICVIDLIFYNCFNYTIFRILNINSYSIWYLFNILRNTIILNVIYCYITYNLLNYIYKKKDKKMNILRS